MGYRPRIKVRGEAAAYHVVTRVNHKEYRLGHEMKRGFVDLLHKLKTLYYVKYAAFCSRRWRLRNF